MDKKIALKINNSNSGPTNFLRRKTNRNSKQYETGKNFEILIEIIFNIYKKNKFNFVLEILKSHSKENIENLLSIKEHISVDPIESFEKIRSNYEGYRTPSLKGKSTRILRKAIKYLTFCM